MKDCRAMTSPPVFQRNHQPCKPESSSAEYTDRQKMKSPLQRLADWYSRRCNGDWEHTYGITIETVDNPGFSLSIELLDTYLQDVPFQEKKEFSESPTRWMICQRDERSFRGAGAPGRLDDMIEEFLRWAEAHEEPIQLPETTRGK
jgi:hypothetical protein